MADYASNILKAPKVVCDIRSMNQSSIAVPKRIDMIERDSYIRNTEGWKCLISFLN
ncbi:hypothetical protein FDC06_02665 [Clostridium botulinum]|uniref:Uncharacterized protein n=1 Tax=Clostridium botulinum (strain Hall / ATCC 3502 / NCTC 13319 / Type A) TaxID=441771 RepID=A5I793_CLOBH|nr:hypothetical protein [Clostridium botulinum]EPS47110.1 hypothetical protein CFSAN002369_24118 [Clostridium botulinum CFSAN002369]EPS50468.1 hypothetical protein CFSAN002367_12004 [Clostridium botulinum CFSAN002367]CAL84927.1 hypothetical protein CBO3368 [Clostridium botulinum A str. ATCC 3502]AWB19173.1 hypothetical protein DB732_17340 [Clostridium botulinum]AWB31986.1 hypothetical protein DBN47_17635 [Clostridium botulinum]